MENTPDDIFVCIDKTIKTKEGIISFLSEKIASPYSIDNWDGLEDVLMELSWLSCTSVRIIHYELPVLSERDLSIYLSILHNVDSIWSDFERSANCLMYDRCKGVTVYFHKRLIERVKMYL